MSSYDHHKPLDEMNIGDRYPSYGRTITEADCVLFSCLAGLKLPLFIDAEYCKRHSPYGRRIVPGMLTAAYAAGMLEDIIGPYARGAIELSKLAFLKPVFPGDTVTCYVNVTNKRDSSKPDIGILHVLAELINQQEVKVFELTGVFMIKKSRIT